MKHSSALRVIFCYKAAGLGAAALLCSHTNVPRRTTRSDNIKDVHAFLKLTETACRRHGLPGPATGRKAAVVRKNGFRRGNAH
jgi:hypothetical protein